MQTLSRKESPATETVEVTEAGEVTKQNWFSNSKIKQLFHRLLALSRKKSNDSIGDDGGPYHGLQAATAC